MHGATARLYERFFTYISDIQNTTAVATQDLNMTFPFRSVDATELNHESEPF